jgi:hypothetical protein
MEIDIQALATCGVAPDSDAISLGFVDATGSPATIRLSLDQAGALLMTLPGLIDTAVQRNFRDRRLAMLMRSRHEVSNEARRI